jgi:hypothetical protein
MFSLPVSKGRGRWGSRSADRSLAAKLGRGVAAAALAVALGGPAAWAWGPDPRAPREALVELHRHFSLAAHAYPRHGAAPLGVPGFELAVDVTYAPELDEQDFFPVAVAGEPDLDFVGLVRAGARVGLPLGIDVGVSVATVPDADGLDLAAAEVQWAFLEGGALSPALAVRLTGQQTLDPERWELEQYGVELVASKGFTVLTPYVGVGRLRSTSRFERAAGSPLEVETDQTLLFAGATLNLLLPKLTVEVARGETWQAAVRVGFGL